MGFRELIYRVQKYFGFSNQESKEALELMVEVIAVRLDERQRRSFASQLPGILSDLALSVYPSAENSTGDLINQFMRYENLEESKAKKQMIAAWHALNDAIPEGLISMITSILPQTTVLVLG